MKEVTSMYRVLMRTAQQFSDSAYRYVITPTTRILTVFVAAARPEYLVPIFGMDLLQTFFFFFFFKENSVEFNGLLI